MALGPRLGTRIGHGITALAERLTGRSAPAVIPVERIAEAGGTVTLNCTLDDLEGLARSVAAHVMTLMKS